MRARVLKITLRVRRDRLGHAGRSQGRGRWWKSKRTPSTLSDGWTIRRPIRSSRRRRRSSTCATSRICVRAPNTLGAVARVRHCLSMAIHGTSTSRVLLGPHADHHRQRCGGRRRDVPGEHARLANLREIPRTPEGARLHAATSSEGSVPHGQRAAERRDLLPRAVRRSTRSGRRSAPRTATRAGTWPSSGWWSPRSRSPTLRPTRTSRSRSSSTS
jgi:hypothetical protein